MSVDTLTARLVAEVNRLRESQTELENQARNFAGAERIYRMHQAWALLQVDGRNQAERQANAEGLEHDGRTLSDSRYARDLAEGLRTSAIEAVRGQRQVISALQSLIASERSESELLRYAPHEAVGA